MRLATIRVNGEVHAGIVDGATTSVTDLSDGLAALRVALNGHAALADHVATTVPSETVELLSPILRPGKIFGSGINYRGHKEENPSAQMPVEPGFFSKFPSSVIGPEAPIEVPSPDAHVDYEVELAVVIGQPGRNITIDNAYRHVFGLTVVNDVSGRAVQLRPNQMDLGKGCDTFCPMGPCIVTLDEIEDVGAIAIRSWVNGELRQDATTADWIYSIPELIAHASKNITLESGDLITTGTPAGCGTFRTPPQWLTPGDEVIVEAAGIGRLRNPVVAAR